MFAPRLEHVGHLFNAQCNDAIVGASTFGGDASDGEAGIVGVGASLNKFGIFECAHLSVRGGGVHRATSGQLSHWQLTRVGQGAENRVTSSSDINTYGCCLAVMGRAIDRETEESFEGTFALGDRLGGGHVCTVEKVLDYVKVL